MIWKLWNFLKTYSVGGQLLGGTEAFYRESSACVMMHGELSEFYDRSGSESESAFNIFTDGCMREMKAKVGNVGAKLKMNEISWTVVACLFVDETVLFAE